MGYNSTIVICNDSIHEIENDPDYGKKISDAMARQWSSRGDDRRYVPIGHNSMLIAQHHSSTVSVNLCGGNMGRMIGFTTRTGGGCSKPEDIITALKEVAQTFGFKLVRMSEREKKNKPWLEPYEGKGLLM